MEMIENEFVDGLRNMNDQELVERLNKEVGVTVWVSARGRFLSALRDEIFSRGWIFPEGINRQCGLPFKKKIRLDGQLVNFVEEELQGLSEYELFRKLVGKGLLKGFSAHRDPMNDFFEVDHSIQNRELSAYVTNRLSEENYYWDDLVDWVQGTFTLTEDSIEYGGLEDEETYSDLGGLGGDWGYEHNHRDLWEGLATDLEEELLALGAWTTKQEEFRIRVTSTDTDTIQYQDGQEWLAIPIAQGDVQAWVSRFVRNYIESVDYFILEIVRYEDGVIEFEDLDARSYMSISSGMSNDLDLSTATLTQFEEKDLF